MIKNQSGYYEFDEDIFNNWLDEFGDGDCLQDGCGYNLAGACYDLEGFGSNGCSIDKEFIEDSFNNWLFLTFKLRMFNLLDQLLIKNT